MARGVATKAADAEEATLETTFPGCLDGDGRQATEGLDLAPEIASAHLILEYLHSVWESFDEAQQGGGEGRAIQLVRTRVEDHRTKLVEAQSTKTLSRLKDVTLCSASLLPTSSGEYVLRVTNDTEVEEVVVAEEAQSLGHRLADIMDEVAARQRLVRNQVMVAELRQEARATRPSTAPGSTAKLQEYNKIKDVAQELLGLVADNRGVTIGHLYSNDEFGVGKDD